MLNNASFTWDKMRKKEGLKHFPSTECLIWEISKIEPVAQITHTQETHWTFYRVVLYFIKSLKDGRLLFVFRLFTAHIKSIEAAESLTRWTCASTLPEQKEKKEEITVKMVTIQSKVLSEHEVRTHYDIKQTQRNKKRIETLREREERIEQRNEKYLSHVNSFLCLNIACMYDVV